MTQDQAVQALADLINLIQDAGYEVGIGDECGIWVGDAFLEEPALDDEPWGGQK